MQLLRDALPLKGNRVLQPGLGGVGQRAALALRGGCQRGHRRPAHHPGAHHQGQVAGIQQHDVECLPVRQPCSVQHLAGSDEADDAPGQQVSPGGPSQHMQAPGQQQQAGGGQHRQPCSTRCRRRARDPHRGGQHGSGGRARCHRVPARAHSGGTGQDGEAGQCQHRRAATDRVQVARREDARCLPGPEIGRQVERPCQAESGKSPVAGAVPLATGEQHRHCHAQRYRQGDDQEAWITHAPADGENMRTSGRPSARL